MSTLLVGTPLWKAPTVAPTSGEQNSSTLVVLPTATTTAHTIFSGVTVRNGEDSRYPLQVQTTGMALVRVRGPVIVGDTLVAAPGATSKDTPVLERGSYLIKQTETSTAPVAGTAKAPITTAVTKLIWVLLGQGTGGTTSGYEEQTFVIKGIAADWLACITYDEGETTPRATHTAGELIFVARNYRNQTTPFHGRFVNGKFCMYQPEAPHYWMRRKASSGAVTQIETIVPPYYTNALITGKKGITGGTHVYDHLTDPANPVQLDWIDSNDDGRAWGKAQDSLPGDADLVIPI